MEKGGTWRGEGGGGGGVRRDKEGLGRREKRTRNEWRATGKEG